MKIENLDFMDAVKLLANRCGIEINTHVDESTKERMEKSKKFQDIHVEAARFYFSNLIKSKNPGYEYLRKRGLDDHKKIWFRIFARFMELTYELSNIDRI